MSITSSEVTPHHVHVATVVLYDVDQTRVCRDSEGTVTAPLTRSDASTGTLVGKRSACRLCCSLTHSRVMHAVIMRKHESRLRRCQISFVMPVHAASVPPRNPSAFRTHIRGDDEFRHEMVTAAAHVLGEKLQMLRSRGQGSCTCYFPWQATGVPC